MNNFIIAFDIGSKKDLKKFDIDNFDDEELFIRTKTQFDSSYGYVRRNSSPTKVKLRGFPKEGS